MDPRWSNVRNAFIFLSVVGVIYFLTLPDNHRTIRTVSYDVNKPNTSQKQRVIQPTPISIQEIEEEGNFSLWANTKFGTVQYGSTPDAERRGSEVIEGPLSGSERTFLAGRPQFVEDLDNSFSYAFSGPLQGRVAAIVDEKKGDMRNQLTESDSRKRIRKEREWFSLSTVFPNGGNTLPNYLIHGIMKGISSSDYQNGIVAFLHHNKAAGSSIKLCLNMMVNRGVMKNHSLLVLSSKVLSRRSLSDILEYDAFVGGYTFWLCEYFKGVNCSYFTVLRDPYDRVLSSYFYCKEQHWDQLCGPLGVGNFTIQQWAIYQGSYFFHQLLMDKKYCEANKVIADLFKYGLNDILIPPGTSRYISLKKAHMCWIKQRIYFNTFVSKSGREVLLKNILDNLETWFSVIGLTEEFDLSLKMLSITYDLPFYRRCRGKVLNQSPAESNDEVKTRERLKLELKSSPEVVEALSYDTRIYEKGKDIFQRQKEQLDTLLKRSGTRK